MLVHGLLYLGGLAVTNSALGVVAALTGGLMGSMLQNPLVLVAVAAILVFFATSLFGFWELRLPGSLTQAASKSYAGYFGSLFMGLTLGVVAAPCIGPFVLGFLTWVASMGSPWLGFLVFFTLSLGLGLPLFILALFSGSLERLPRSGEWMLWVRKLMGWVLLAMAAYFVRPLLPETASQALLAGVALAAAINLGWLDRSTATFRSFPWLKTAVALAGVIIATFLVGSWALRGPGVTWQPYSDQVLAQARASAQAGNHRFLRHLVHPLPGVGGDYLSSSRRGETGGPGFCHAQSGPHPERQSGASAIAQPVRHQRSAHGDLSGRPGQRVPEFAAGGLSAPFADAAPHGRRRRNNAI